MNRYKDVVGGDGSIPLCNGHNHISCLHCGRTVRSKLGNDERDTDVSRLHMILCRGGMCMCYRISEL